MVSVERLLRMMDLKGCVGCRCLFQAHGLPDLMFALSQLIFKKREHSMRTETVIHVDGFPLNFNFLLNFRFKHSSF